MDKSRHFLCNNDFILKSVEKFLSKWSKNYFRWIVLRGVIWHLFFVDLSQSEKLSEIKPPLVTYFWTKLFIQKLGYLWYYVPFHAWQSLRSVYISIALHCWVVIWRKQINILGFFSQLWFCYHYIFIFLPFKKTTVRVMRISFVSNGLWPRSTLFKVNRKGHVSF